MLVIIAAGLVVTVYLLTKSGDPNSVACSLGGHCAEVLTSKYAKLFGYPISAYGLFWYLASLILVWFTFFQKILRERFLAVWMLGGLGFVFYMTGIEAFILHSYCTWCLATAGLTTALFLLFFVRKNIVKKVLA